MLQVWLSLNLVVSLLTSLASESPEVPEDTRNMEIINLLLGKDGIDVNLHPELKSPPLLTTIQWILVEAVESLFARDEGVSPNQPDLDARACQTPGLVQSQGNRKVGMGPWYIQPSGGSEDAG